MTRKLFALTACLLFIPIVPSLAADDPWPARVLITNDDGLDDRERLMTVASTFAPSAEVWVVVPRENRSGTGSYLSLQANSTIAAERLHVEEATESRHRIELWAVDGFPADCVVFALKGLLVTTPPDLVVSGINGGANLGHAWFGSGTIGAARMAAFAGVPALAVSGMDEEMPESALVIAQWVVNLAASPVTRELRPGQYLTVGLPEIPPQEIKGIRVVDRAPLDFPLILAPIKAVDPFGDRTIWAFQPSPTRAEPIHDRAVVDDGFIAVTPMQVDEVDRDALRALAASTGRLPAWEGASPVVD